MKEWNVTAGLQIFLVLLFAGLTVYAFMDKQIAYRDCAEIIVGLIVGYRVLMERFLPK
jgi:hypothetical protein